MKKEITNQLTLFYFKSTFLNSFPNVGICNHFELGISQTFLHQQSEQSVRKMLRISLLYLIYKPYNHIDWTVFIEDSFACKCLFPQTDLIELNVMLCTLLLKLISLAFRQNKQTPLPFKALLDLRLEFKSKIFHLLRLIAT